MRKITGIFVLLVLVLMAFKSQSDSSCPTQGENNNRTTITCGSCHYSAINPDIIIGKDATIISDGSTYQVSFDLYDPEYELMEVSVNIDKAESKIITAMHSSNQIVLSTANDNAVSGAEVVEPTSGKKENILELFFDIDPEKFVVPLTVEVQGVLANMDGTADGDVAFKREIHFLPERQSTEFQVYPTQASSVIHVFVPEADEERSIIIYNATGKRVKTMELYDTETVLSIEELDPGYYFIQVSDENSHQQTKRFIVSK